ncbi:hypothetical protein C8Q76DRAFT_709310 [Earliella scabrosa]|nr:hypothetical protein C8Q76DRAFT_709310 [Earliella scabrosa]
MTIYFGPNPGTYGVIRMDPVAMVQHLNDPEAMAAAQAMQPKSYLVYLEHILALPFPGQPWFPFTVLVVGPGLRPPNEEECITADMCTPIFPNLAHPTGRASLRTEPTFPYSNCAHWQCPELNVRICARDEGFDDGLAIKLPVDDQEQLELDIVLDQTRVLEARHARNALLAPPVRPPASFKPTASTRPDLCTAAPLCQATSPRRRTALKPCSTSSRAIPKTKESSCRSFISGWIWKGLSSRRTSLIHWNCLRSAMRL